MTEPIPGIPRYYCLAWWQDFATLEAFEAEEKTDLHKRNMAALKGQPDPHADCRARYDALRERHEAALLKSQTIFHYPTCLIHHKVSCTCGIDDLRALLTDAEETADG